MKALISLEWNKTFKMVKFKIRSVEEQRGHATLGNEGPKNCSQITLVPI